MEGTIEPTTVAYPDRVACPQCAAMLPASPRYATWCDSCGWNVVSADRALRDVDRGPFRRRYDALVLRTAERMHRQLLTGEPNTGHRSADAILVVLSALVLLVFLAFVALIVWWTISGSGFWHWPAALAGTMVVVALLLSLRTRKDDSRSSTPTTRLISTHWSPRSHRA